MFALTVASCLRNSGSKRKLYTTEPRAPRFGTTLLATAALKHVIK